jgi:Delta3-Delta2-enoyl-CoA isomerase
MNFVRISRQDGIATVTLARGKVNALNEAMIDEIKETLDGLEPEEGIKAIIITGQGKFFSFGFDVPEFLDYAKEDFTRYLTKFSDLLTGLFLFPKPVVAALNGHTIAGGCMLAVACDSRIMLAGRTKISLNEITFGSSVLTSTVEMLTNATGAKNAEYILKTGAMFSAEEARGLGLIDAVASAADLPEAARARAWELGHKDPAAFASVKTLLRRPRVESIRQQEAESIREFVDIWYSESTREKLRGITIHS